MRFRRRRTFNEAIKYIESYTRRSKRQLKLLGYRSKEVSNTLQQLVSLSNSVAIIFLQRSLEDGALRVLKEGLGASMQLYFEGESTAGETEQRSLLYMNYAYLMQLLNDYQSSLKFLYDSETTLKEENDGDLSIAHSMLCFLVLFKIHKYEQAARYIGIAAAEFQVIQSRKSRYGQKNKDNLFCLISLALQVLNDEGVLQGNLGLEEVLDFSTANECAAMSLVGQYLESKPRNDSFHIVLSEEFRDILFLTCFFPFIHKNTPPISERSLSNAKRPEVYLPSDMYGFIIQEALANVSNN